MKRVLLVLTILGAVAASPATAGATTVSGTVVAKEHGKLLVASPAGLVTAVAGRATLGSRVAVRSGRAAVVGRAHNARVRGIVIRRLGPFMYISSNHHVVAVRATLRKLADTTPAPTSTAPAPGDVVSTTVTIEAGGLDEDDTTTVGHANDVLIQAQVVSVGAGTVTLLVNGTQVPVSLPAGLTLPSTLVGQMVSLTLNLNNQNDDENDDDQGGDDHGGDHGQDGGGDD